MHLRTPFFFLMDFLSGFSIEQVRELWPLRLHDEQRLDPLFSSRCMRNFAASVFNSGQVRRLCPFILQWEQT